jgi:hypothetical protein
MPAAAGSSMAVAPGPCSSRRGGHGSAPRAGAELFEPPVLIEDITECDDGEDDVDEDDGDDASGAARASTPSAAGAGAGLDAFLVHPSAPAPSPSSTLSPNAAPFRTRGSTAGWPKARCWADEDLIDANLHGTLSRRCLSGAAAVDVFDTFGDAPAVHPAFGLRRCDAGPLAEGGTSAVGRGHNWCTACRLAQWRAASWHASASATIDGSLPLTPTGGGRSSTGRRRVR